MFKPKKKFTWKDLKWDACPVHFIEWEDGCITCQRIVEKYITRLVIRKHIGIETMPKISWKKKLSLIKKHQWSLAIPIGQTHTKEKPF